jgi:Tfp pilus assembly protein PilO
LEIEDAAEPTDIIWENRHFTYSERFQRTIIVILVVFLLLFISFVFIFFCTKQAGAATLKYPAANCTSIYEDYNNNAANIEKLAF